ncbi:MAG: hypothetical protein Q9174_001578 [Haloplaca sp. 1 TL-2023]
MTLHKSNELLAAQSLAVVQTKMFKIFPPNSERQPLDACTKLQRQIMDPKMDSGFLADGETLEDDYDVLQPMLPEELVGLMDQLLGHEEEDFVSNLYNRSLLSSFDTLEIQGLLDEALNSVKSLSLGNTPARDAILARLTFRQQLLKALASDLATDEATQVQHWGRCLDLLPRVQETRVSAKAVPKASSVKVQRTLASSVPPRPMVEVAFEDAHKFLRHLCQDAAEVFQILDCTGSSSVLVCGEHHNRLITH